jgi:hypothetical protein
MKADELANIVTAAAIEIGGKKKLACSTAFELAEKHSVPLREIGESCNRNGIKIIRCQLGCFE